MPMQNKVSVKKAVHLKVQNQYVYMAVHQVPVVFKAKGDIV